MEQTTKKEVKKSSSSNRVIQFFKDLKSEFKRITWPSKEQIGKSSVAVLIFCLIWVVITGLLDYSFSNLYTIIFK